MGTFQVAYNADDKIVKVQVDGTAVGDGFEDIGSFDHVNDEDDQLGPDVNHVLYHHVRDLLYKEGEQNMQSVQIHVPVSSITSTPEAKQLSIGDGDTVQIVNVIAPAIAQNSGVTYTSSDEDVATVDANGVVTPVAVGEATITVEAVDGYGAEDTVAITVVA